MQSHQPISSTLRNPGTGLWLSAKVALLALIALFALVPTVARAADNPAARSLFDAGVKLMDEGKPDEACPKFEESLRLQQSVGAQLNLARCHEQQGRVATAWTEYKKAATMAHTAGDADREKTAADLGEALEAKLPKLVVIVAKPVKGLLVLKDGVELGPGAFGVAIATDPGPHRIEASAPGHKGRVIPVEVALGPAEHTVEVAELEIDPSIPARASLEGAVQGPGGSANTGDASQGGSGTILVPTGIALGVTGVVVAGIGAVLGGLVLSDASKVDGDASLCPEKQCTVAGQSIIDSARPKATASTVLIAAGSAVAIAGLILLVVGTQSSGEEQAAEPATKARVVPLLAPAVAGLMVSGAF